MNNQQTFQSQRVSEQRAAGFIPAVERTAIAHSSAGMNPAARLVVLACLTVLFTGCGASAPTGPRSLVIAADDDGKAIFDKGVQALGGADKLPRWNIGAIKYKATGSGEAAGAAEAVVEDTFQLPGRFKRVARIKRGGEEKTITVVVRDGKGWEKKGDAEVREAANDAADKKEHPFAVFANLRPMLEPDVKLIRAGEMDVNGTPCQIVRVDSPRLDPLALFFDKNTALLLKTRKTIERPGSPLPSVVDTYLSDYKDVNGALVPMRIKGFQGDKAILDVNLLEVRFPDKIDDAEFAKP